VFGPKALAGIGRLPDTLADRSIPICLARRTSSETVKRFRRVEAHERTESIRAALVEWAQASADRLRACRPIYLEALSDRAAEGWQPLLAIAEMAGHEWLSRAVSAAIELQANVDEADESLPIRLLADIRHVFTLKEVAHLPTEQLIQDLL